jgi:hypothetical protein
MVSKTERYYVAYAPDRTGRRHRHGDWAILLRAYPRSMVISRRPSEAEAQIVADSLNAHAHDHEIDR